MRRSGFTVVELLIVMAIIAILTAIIFPIIGAAKTKAKEVNCRSNLTQIGAALQIYREYFDDRLPERLSHLNPGYATHRQLFICPLDPVKGKREGNDRLEGTMFLPSGVSYTWVPNWQKAIEWGWWAPWPLRGKGLWGERTPVVECHWHWAKKFNQNWEFDRSKHSSGNALILLKDGSVITWPGRRPISEYEP